MHSLSAHNQGVSAVSQCTATVYTKLKTRCDAVMYFGLIENCICITVNTGINYCFGIKIQTTLAL